MLYRVEVENFCSIREPQVIDLRVAANVPDIPGRFAPVWPGAEQRIPKTIAIFGANASGKSTVLKIVSFLASFVLHSFAAQPTRRIMFDRFNDAEALGQPARFAVEFGGLPTSQTPPRRCAGIATNSRSGPRQRAGAGFREALFYWPEREGKRRTLFDRREDGKVDAAKPFGLGAFKASLNGPGRTQA